MMVEPRTKKRRQSSFLDTSARIEGIIEILKILEKKPMYYRQIFRVTRIRLSTSVLRYLNYCKEKGFVTGVEQLMKIPNGRGFSTKAKYFTIYSVSEKGKLFLELVK